jgi:hypothetical protein
VQAAVDVAAALGAQPAAQVRGAALEQAGPSVGAARSATLPVGLEAADRGRAGSRVGTPRPTPASRFRPLPAGTIQEVNVRGPGSRPWYRARAWAAPIRARSPSSAPGSPPRRRLGSLAPGPPRSSWRSGWPRLDPAVGPRRRGSRIPGDPSLQGPTVTGPRRCREASLPDRPTAAAVTDRPAVTRPSPWWRPRRGTKRLLRRRRVSPRGATAASYAGVWTRSRGRARPR